jgi:hypothetical protein
VAHDVGGLKPAMAYDQAALTAPFGSPSIPRVAQGRLKIWKPRPFKQTLSNKFGWQLAEIFHEHGLALFAAGLIECDAVAVAGSSEPEWNMVQDCYRCGPIFRIVVKAEHRLVTE